MMQQSNQARLNDILGGRNRGGGGELIRPIMDRKHPRVMTYPYWGPVEGTSLTPPTGELTDVLGWTGEFRGLCMG